MASNSSGELAPGNSYTIGQYTFSISSEYNEGNHTTYITAYCSYGEDTGIKQTTVGGEADLVSWHVELSDNVADVYALVNKKIPGTERTSDLDTGRVSQPIHCGGKAQVHKKDIHLKPLTETLTAYNNTFTYLTTDSTGFVVMAVSKEPDVAVESAVTTRVYTDKVTVNTTSINVHNRYEHDGKIAYWSSLAFSGVGTWNILDIGYRGSISDRILLGKIAWTILYGESSYILEPEEVFVGRFQIIPEDADPEDWDDPIDDGDPDLTLKVTIRGALSGRHNDPIYDTSYSYIPADNPTVKDYGCGGDGGYGGGGGAGASTVIVYKYSTSKAGSHETYAYARRHGYGSGGGKGGKGGDGCIIIYW